MKADRKQRETKKNKGGDCVMRGEKQNDERTKSRNVCKADVKLEGGRGLM